MDTQKLMNISTEIVNIFTREELTRIESLYALEATMAKIHEQSLREIIRDEMKIKNPPLPGVN